MRKILITRSLENYQRTSNNLLKLGFTTIHSPMMIFSLKTFIIPDINNISALIFTSSNGIRAIKDINNFNLPCYVVGEQTAKTAKKYGFKILAQGNNNIKSLSNIIKKDYKMRCLSSDLLYVSSTHETSNLSDIFNNSLIKIKSIKAYEMLEQDFITNNARQAFINNDIEAILLYSTRTAKIFIKNIQKIGFLQKIRNISIYCLSKKIAMQFYKLYFKRIYFTEYSNEIALLKLLH